MNRLPKELKELLNASYRDVLGNLKRHWDEERFPREEFIFKKAYEVLFFDLNAVQEGKSLEERLETLGKLNIEKVYTFFRDRASFFREEPSIGTIGSYYTRLRKVMRKIITIYDPSYRIKDLYYERAGVSDAKAKNQRMKDLIVCRIVDIPLQIKLHLINGGTVKIKRLEERIQEGLDQVWKENGTKIQERLLERLDKNLERHQAEKKIYAWQDLCLAVSYSLGIEPLQLLMMKKNELGKKEFSRSLFPSEKIQQAWLLLKGVHDCSHLHHRLVEMDWVNLYRVTYEHYSEFDSSINPRDFIWFSKIERAKKLLSAADRPTPENAKEILIAEGYVLDDIPLLLKSEEIKELTGITKVGTKKRSEQRVSEKNIQPAVVEKEQRLTDSQALPKKKEPRLRVVKPARKANYERRASESHER